MTLKQFSWSWKAVLASAVCAVAVSTTSAQTPDSNAPSAQSSTSRNLAPGFESRPATSRLVIVPTDIELFSLSAGGVLEPKADWTEAANRHFTNALAEKARGLGGQVTSIAEKDLDELAELSALHGAVATAIFVHHFMPAGSALPTKEGKLDWTLGDAVTGLRARSGADYALFTWIRDSYATAERKAAIVAMAFLGVGLAGGAQIGYASLVDLRTGRVVWFNNLMRGTGDLREAEPAKETLGVLLNTFPAAR